MIDRTPQEYRELAQRTRPYLERADTWSQNADGETMDIPLHLKAEFCWVHTIAEEFAKLIETHGPEIDRTERGKFLEEHSLDFYEDLSTAMNNRPLPSSLLQLLTDDPLRAPFDIYDHLEREYGGRQ